MAPFMGKISPSMYSLLYSAFSSRSRYSSAVKKTLGCEAMNRVYHASKGGRRLENIEGRVRKGKRGDGLRRACAIQSSEGVMHFSERRDEKRNTHIRLSPAFPPAFPLVHRAGNHQAGSAKPA